VAAARILIFDGEVAMRQTIARMLGSAGHEWVGAGNLAEAREALDKNGFDLVLCELVAPGEDGMELVAEIVAVAAETPVLLVTSIDDPEVAHRAAVLGANAYLVRPFSLNQLLINVDYALRDGVRREEAAGVERAEERRRVAEVRNATLRLERAARVADKQAAELLSPLSEAVGRRDLETGAHIRRVGEFSGLLAEASGIELDEVQAIRLAAPMHDIGKVAIPDSILLKPGGLDPVERRLVERHAEIGHDILSGSSSHLLELAAEIALTHHEKLDGSGYPRGLIGEEIPVAGRIVAVADVYDALTSDRPYRSALPVEEAQQTMIAQSGTHFDPTLLELFLERSDAVQALGVKYADKKTRGQRSPARAGLS
jgi:putative two-component system response regulator